jgi:hypothetical protein
MIESSDAPTDSRGMSPNLRASRTGGRIAAVAASVGLLLAGVACASQRPPAQPPARLAGGSLVCSQAAGWLGPSSPPACWRPYADSSPFNQEIPLGARVPPNSARVVSRLLSFGPLQHLTAGDAGRTDDFGRAAYFNRPGDPVFAVHCTMPWGTCPVEGQRIRIPDAARVPGGSDGHVTVVDQASGWEYDFWRVQSKPRGGGRLAVAWGGRTRIAGDGLGSSAVAARFGTLAGLLRPEEIQAGQINHALALSVHCDSGTFVYPASHRSSSCASLGLPNADAPAIGTRFQLAMTPAQIDALDVPAYRKTVLWAMARYGMYVADTGGTWGLIKGSGLVTTSFGLADRWVQLARAVGAPYWAPDCRYAINIRDGVDWARYLRVIAPCVAQRTC